MSAEEARDYGIIDVIYTPNSPAKSRKRGGREEDKSQQA